MLVDAKYAVQVWRRSLVGKPHELDFAALKHLKWPGTDEDFLFLDIGANRGQTISSVRMFRNFKIVCVEPIPTLAEKLKRRATKDPGLTVIQAAASDAAGTLRLYIPRYKNFSFDGLASTQYDAAASWLGPDKLFGFDPAHLHVDEVNVPAIRIDDLNLTPSFVKIDVQGAEIFTLRGMVETISRHHPIILLERPELDIEVAFLAEHGYSPCKFDGHSFTPGVKDNLNTFFLREEHHAMFSIPFND
ncbi:FkbM family methyltransferase [Brevundimonas sp.]|uniref:FkbM family methyltransferase n=1 Tax=Brevundimonas sp. TaxID=1871086 RepID=UPI002D2A0FF5|nr:FkbM family methyltransferase [Brevundimonas sp.]HYD28107.1 FkbM family methyltransferase [Brevundimonas sp.]